MNLKQVFKAGATITTFVVLLAAGIAVLTSNLDKIKDQFEQKAKLVEKAYQKFQLSDKIYRFSSQILEAYSTVGW